MDEYGELDNSTENYIPNKLSAVFDEFVRIDNLNWLDGFFTGDSFQTFDDLDNWLTQNIDGETYTVDDTAINFNDLLNPGICSDCDEDGTEDEVTCGLLDCTWTSGDYLNKTWAEAHYKINYEDDNFNFLSSFYLYPTVNVDGGFSFQDRTDGTTYTSLDNYINTNWSDEDWVDTGGVIGDVNLTYTTGYINLLETATNHFDINYCMRGGTHTNVFEEFSEVDLGCTSIQSDNFGFIDAFYDANSSSYSFTDVKTDDGGTDDVTYADLDEWLLATWDEADGT